MHLMQELSDRLTQLFSALMCRVGSWIGDAGAFGEDRELSDDEAALFDAMLGLPPI